LASYEKLVPKRKTIRVGLSPHTQTNQKKGNDFCGTRLLIRR
jgi:hypothetical protein